MKLGVLILLLANFAVFLWFRWAPPATPAPEGGLAPVASAAHPLEVLDTRGAGGKCLVIGAGTDATSARAQAARLRQRGFAARAVPRTQQQASGYWVLVTGFADAGAARAAADKLRRGGIRDLFVLNGARDGGASLSLGLFRDFEHARRRAARVRELGFQPQIRERFRTTPRWAVQVPATASARAAFPATAAVPASCRRSELDGD